MSREAVTTIEPVMAAVSPAHPEMIRLQRESYQNEIWKIVLGSESVKAPERARPGRGERLLADYAALAVHLARADSEDLYRSASFGLAAYRNGLWDVAERVAKNVRFAASTSAALGEVMRGLVLFVLAIVGLSDLALTPLSFLHGDFVRAVWAVLDENPQILVGTGFGILGSIVSLLLRLPEFEIMQGRSRQFLLLTGCTLPIVGGTFAAVISALFASHVISFSLSGTDPGTPDIRLFFLIGFLSGFSERFSRGLLTSVENRLMTSLAKEGAARCVAEMSTCTCGRTAQRAEHDPSPPAPPKTVPADPTGGPEGSGEASAPGP
jgi:hypothetical protein